MDQKNEGLDTKEKLEEYQRKFRNLESDRKSYAEESAAVIYKQRNIIDKVKQENTQLRENISRMKVQNQSFGQKPQMSENDIEDIKVLLKEEEESQHRIQKHIDDFQRKIIEKKRTLGGWNAGAENETALQKQIKILENRLDKANQKFNEAIAVNKQLRQTIDSLRRERVIFDNLYKKLEKELHEKRKQMANIIETANTAYEERDKANDQIQNLKQQAKRESADFEKDLRELSQIMEKNKKNIDLMKLNDKNRDDNKFSNDMMESDKFQKMKQQKFFKDRNISQNILDKKQKYEEDFAKIQAATKITDFEQLVNIFVENEEKNFNTFKFVNEQSNEIEDLEKQIAELKSEIEDYNGPGNNLDLQNKKKLKDLEERLSRAENKSEQFEFKYHDANKLINSLTNWIETLFNTIECDKEIAKELAGSHGVTDGNMMIFLGIIEHKINQIVQAYSAIKAEKSNDDYHQIFTNASNLSNLQQPSKSRNEMPTFAEELEEEETEGDKILTLEDFKKKAIEKLEFRRQQPMGKNKKSLPKGKKKQ